jgi:cell division protein FtsN
MFTIGNTLMPGCNRFVICALACLLTVGVRADIEITVPDAPDAPAAQTEPTEAAAAPAPIVAAPPVVTAAPPAPAPAVRVPSPPGTIFTVQLGAFKARERAFALYWELAKKIQPVQVTAPAAKDGMYRVRYGSYPNYDEAKAAVEKLKKLQINAFVTPLDASAPAASPAQETN